VKRAKSLVNTGMPKGLPATHSGPKPGDFPLGSLESRAAVRAILNGIASTDCICFPPDEPPGLELPVEIEAARAVRCPVHGERFTKLAPALYRVITHPYHLGKDWRKWHSRQYIKAMDASFPLDRWPAGEIVEPDDSVRFVLKDGTEVLYVPPPPPIYDYNTDEPTGEYVRRRPWR
jgi:hypothetical protein